MEGLQRSARRALHLHFTPLHASWVNQIELLFGIYTRRVLRHASHRSVAHLRQRTEEFIAQRNLSPKPFRWTPPASSCKLASLDISPLMPTALFPNRASELQRLLAELTGHTAAHVRPYGKHLLIQMQRDDSLDTVARLTEASRNRYTAAFRTHSGRWEPLSALG